MYSDQYVFSQLVSILDKSKFNRIVQKYCGDAMSAFYLLELTVGSDVRRVELLGQKFLRRFSDFAGSFRNQAFLVEYRQNGYLSAIALRIVFFASSTSLGTFLRCRIWLSSRVRRKSNRVLSPSCKWQARICVQWPGERRHGPRRGRKHGCCRERRCRPECHSRCRTC